MTLESESIVQAWRDWVNEPVEPAKRLQRKLIVQIINAQNFPLKWESYENSVKNMVFCGYLPHQGCLPFVAATKFAARYNWIPSEVRKVLR
jgi:hypothetical protein